MKEPQRKRAAMNNFQYFLFPVIVAPGN